MVQPFDAHCCHMGTARVVNETYDAETETRRQSLEIETRPRHWSDGLETRPRRQCHQSEMRRSKQRLETFSRDVQDVTIVIRGYTTSTV